MYIISSSGCVLFLTEKHRRTEHTKAHKDSGPSPDPSPGGKGSDHRDTPIRRISALCCPLSVSTIVLTLCDVCMPKAFCGFETVRKWVLLNLWVLWEKNSPASLAIVLFLTEEHRRTEHTAFHRDIKSTDNTERYCQHPSLITHLLPITQHPSRLIINTQHSTPNIHQNPFPLLHNSQECCKFAGNKSLITSCQNL